jgi:hypothetical protein
MRFLTFCYLTLKFICRVAFTAHVIALATLGWFLHHEYQGIGLVRPAHVTTSGDFTFVAVLVSLFLCMGWLAGSEFGHLQVRTLRRLLKQEREHAADMRRLNISMVDDVLLAARNGLPVKTFSSGGRGTGDELDQAAHAIDRAARDGERRTAPHNVESDYIGRL